MAAGKRDIPDRPVNEQVLVHARALRALDDYDADAFKQGLGAVIALVLGVALLLVVLVAY